MSLPWGQPALEPGLAKPSQAAFWPQLTPAWGETGGLCSKRLSAQSHVGRESCLPQDCLHLVPEHRCRLRNRRHRRRTVQRSTKCSRGSTPEARASRAVLRRRQESQLQSNVRSEFTRARSGSQGTWRSPLRISVAMGTRDTLPPTILRLLGQPCPLPSRTVPGEAATATRPPAS